MIDYTKVVDILINITSILFFVGIISKIKIIVAPAKIRALINITNSIEEILNNNHNKNIIYEYLEKEFNLKKDEKGEYNYTLKQIENAIKARERRLNIDEDEYLDFVVSAFIINTINWCNKKSIKLALKLCFVCICIMVGQASLDIYNSR